MSMAEHLAASMGDKARRGMADSGWAGDSFLFAGPTEMAVAFSRRGLLDEGGFTPLGSAVRDVIGRGKAELSDRRDTDRSGEAGQTAKQAGPVGQEQGPKASPK